MATKFPSSPPAPVQAASLLGRPAEIRVKIYQALFDEFTVIYSLTDKQWKRAKNGVFPDPGKVPRTCEPNHPLAILDVSKRIRRESLPIEPNRVLHLEFRKWGRSLNRDPLLGPCRLVRLPNNIRNRVCSIATDEYWAHHWIIKCCLNDHFPKLFPNVRTLEIKRRPKTITHIHWRRVNEMIENEVQEYQFCPEECARIVRSWPVPGTGFSWRGGWHGESDEALPLRYEEGSAKRLEEVIGSGRLSIKMPGDLFGSLPLYLHRGLRPTDVSMRGILIWDNNGMKLTDMARWEGDKFNDYIDSDDDEPLEEAHMAKAK
ncbi:hypothetical protein H2200_001964 [Cladophialophora chaetospira]|uniref:Uncharacterized protein n=1 Tax=Cladophialophora chaetospira TaxID=386627 RepID=A0AA38XLV7_9EURO|nr:hypothetical protein H2200_001964 [Cladophialophora chaetospira]